MRAQHGVSFVDVLVSMNRTSHQNDIAHRDLPRNDVTLETDGSAGHEPKVIQRTLSNYRKCFGI